MAIVKLKEKKRYLIIKELGDEFVKLVRVGLIPSHLLGWRIMYDTYIRNLKENNKTKSIKLVADEYKISERQFYIIIKYMES